MNDVSQHKNSGLPGYFLGDLIQVAAVTNDFDGSLEKMIRLGIGPWAVYTVDSSSMSRFTYRGHPAPACSFRMGLARIGELTWEVIQPLGGQSIYADFLRRHGNGVQHLAFNCNNEQYDKQVELLVGGGYDIIQSGVWMDSVRFHYFATEQDIGTVVEIIHFPRDFVFPQPEAVVPAQPSA